MFIQLQSRVKHVSTKLLVVLLVCLACGAALLGFINIRMHRKNLEDTSLQQGIEISDFVRDTTYRSMMANDRHGLGVAIQSIGNHQQIEHVRIINHTGRVAFSSDPGENGTALSLHSTECQECHHDGARPDAAKRFRIFQSPAQNGTSAHRVLGVITPILNRPECADAECHAHPASQRVLGVLDTDLSLRQQDAYLAQTSAWLIGLLLLGAAAVGLLTVAAIHQILHRPLQLLREGTGHLADGELGYQIPFTSGDELGALAAAFNSMSRQLQAAQREITGWAHTLEHRVEQKTSELQNTQQQMLRVERMIAIGRMAAVVAHEINNPLAGILTYSKLIKRWIQRGISGEEQKQEAIESLDLIASESKRCGELLQNLLSFSRTSPINLSVNDINAVVARTIRLSEHKAEIAGVLLKVDLDRELPPVQCDPAQIEQVMLALMINAIDAMPHGGNLWISSRLLPDGEYVELQVRDDGIGIPPELMSRIFDPFTTTKEVGKGVGLGLAVSKGIVERHGGRIDVSSELGVGTTFRIILPRRTVNQEPPPAGTTDSSIGVAK
ncbi:MAG: ATP-binding protein [Acidobacteriota bacterium]|nr:ATP-binding protein [Acidobacteriota bacterium]